ncbi:MAG: nitroreductase family protein, partial [Candidatus Nanoarchaeia archaeon]
MRNEQNIQFTQTMNETIKSIFARRSVRNFIDKDIPDDIILTILESANKAPSAHNQQSWKFIVIKGQKKDELAKLVSDSSDLFPKPSSTLLRMAARSILSSPVTIAIINTGDLIKHGTELFKIEKDAAYDFFRTMEIQSSAAAVENMLIAATSLGVASVWLGIMYL